MNIDALTTAFVPGPGCNDTIYGKIYSSGTVRDKWHSLGQTDTSSCYPPSFTAPDAYYSPGICPSAWSSACGRVESIGTMTETRVTCCPAGYICATPQGSPWDTFSCSRFYNDTPKLIVPQEINGKTTYMETMLGGPIVAYADQIEVRFQKTDFATAASTTMASASSSQTGTQTSAETSRTGEMVKPMNTAPGNGSGADSVVKSENAGKNGLTTGSYAGIGVVVGVVTIALVAVLLFLIRMRRKESGEAGILDGDWIQDDRAAEMANSTSTCEVGAREVGEVRGDTVMPVELDQKTMVHQLE